MHIALVLSDMGLPRLDGYEMFQRLKELEPEVKVILAGGYLEPNLKSKIFRAGVKDFVQKPYLPAHLLKKVREAIDAK